MWQLHRQSDAAARGREEVDGRQLLCEKQEGRCSSSLSSPPFVNLSLSACGRKEKTCLLVVVQEKNPGSSGDVGSSSNGKKGLREKDTSCEGPLPSPLPTKKKEC